MIIGKGGAPAVPSRPVPPAPAPQAAPAVNAALPAVPAPVKSPVGLLIAVFAGLITLAVLVVLFFTLKK
jgi:hypothetical protein